MENFNVPRNLQILAILRAVTSPFGTDKWTDGGPTDALNLTINSICIISRCFKSPVINNKTKQKNGQTAVRPTHLTTTIPVAPIVAEGKFTINSNYIISRCFKNPVSSTEMKLKYDKTPHNNVQLIFSSKFHFLLLRTNPAKFHISMEDKSHDVIVMVV